MITLTEKTLPLSRMIVLRVTNKDAKVIAVHTSKKRLYIDKMISRYARMGIIIHKNG